MAVPPATNHQNTSHTAPDAVSREAVYVFGSDEEIVAEMLLGQFARLTRREESHPILSARAASLVRAAYCVIGNRLKLQAVVFFQFLVDDEGFVDASFNLPLDYLARQAGGFALGERKIRKASRGQCPVPWHSVNLWEPESPQTVHDLQGKLLANQLGFVAQVYDGEDTFFADDQTHQADQSNIELTPLSEFQADRINPPKTDIGQMTDRLSQVFGQSGKLSVQELIRLHSEQMEQLRDEFRREFEVVQVNYLDQIRVAQEEIHQLKTALRQEQGRSHRLQQMLRGDL